MYSLQKPGIGGIYRKQQIEVHKYPELYPVASGEEKTSTDVVEEWYASLQNRRNSDFESDRLEGGKKSNFASKQGSPGIIEKWCKTKPYTG